MKCPYCIGEIDDGAVVCAHCSHDLFFVRPLLERLAAVEGRLADLDGRLERAEGALSDLAAAASVSVAVPDRRDGRDAPFRVAYLAVILVAGLLGTACLYYYQERGGSTAFLYASMIVPLPAGLVIGLWWPGRHPVGYVLAGLLLGAANLVAGNIAPGTGTGKGWGVAAGLLVAGVATLFVSGGLIGDWLERFKTSPPPSLFASRIAASLVPATAGASRELRTKRLAELISGVEKILLPILLALLSIWGQSLKASPPPRPQTTSVEIEQAKQEAAPRPERPPRR